VEGEISHDKLVGLVGCQIAKVTKIENPGMSTRPLGRAVQFQRGKEKNAVTKRRSRRKRNAYQPGGGQVTAWRMTREPRGDVYRSDAGKRGGRISALGSQNGGINPTGKASERLNGASSSQKWKNPAIGRSK